MLTRLRRSNAYARIGRHEVARQFVKYAIVGCINVAIYFAIFNLLLFAGVPALGANAVAFLFSSVNSFALNKVWSFRDPRREAVVRQYAVFVAFTLVGLALNTGAFSLLLIPLRGYGTLGKNLAAMLAIPVSVAWNFWSYRKWAFNPGASRPLRNRESASV